MCHDDDTLESLQGDEELEAGYAQAFPGYLRREHRYGVFSRMVTLPIAIQSEKTQATFENGMLTLTLTLPKAEAMKPKQIKVKANSALEIAKKQYAWGVSLSFGTDRDKDGGSDGN